MKAFKGYMRMYAKTVGTKIAKTEYTEEWADPKIRKRILGKPRKYSITIYMYNDEGDHIVETIPLPCKATKDDLSMLVFDQVNRMVREQSDQTIKLTDTYINIRA